MHGGLLPMSQLSQLSGVFRHHRIGSDIGHFRRGDVLADLFDEPRNVIQQLVRREDRVRVDRQQSDEPLEPAQRQLALALLQRVPDVFAVRALQRWTSTESSRATTMRVVPDQMRGRAATGELNVTAPYGLGQCASIRRDPCNLLRCDTNARGAVGPDTHGVTRCPFRSSLGAAPPLINSPGAV